MLINPDRVPNYLKGIYCKSAVQGTEKGMIQCELDSLGICGHQQFCHIVGHSVLSKNAPGCTLRAKAITINK